MPSEILTRTVATVSLLSLIAVSSLFHATAASDFAIGHAFTWSALIGSAGLVGATLRAEARRLHASRQLLIAR